MREQTTIDDASPSVVEVMGLLGKTSEVIDVVIVAVTVQNHEWMMHGNERVGAWSISDDASSSVITAGTREVIISASLSDCIVTHNSVSHVGILPPLPKKNGSSNQCIY